MTFLVSCILALASAPVPVLMTTGDLAGGSGDVIVDTRPYEAYVEGHIPGAVHLDPADLSETRDLVRGMLKPVPEVAELLRARGIAPAKHVVVYSAMEDPDQLKDAARIFWVLEYLGFGNVSVLDGGFAKWRGEDRPVAQGNRTPEPADAWTPAIDRARLASLDDMRRVLSEGGSELLDLRSNAEFRGFSKQDYVDAPGRVRDALNAPATAFVTGPYNTLRPVNEIDAELRAQGVDDTERVITYCNTGRSASVGYFVLRLTGRENVTLYDGSMAEWTARGMPLVCDEPSAGG